MKMVCFVFLTRYDWPGRMDHKAASGEKKWRPVPSWFRLGFRGLSPYSSGILFPHHVLVPARVPGLVSLVLWHCLPSWFPPSFLFQLGFLGLFPYFSFLSQEEDCVPSWFSGSFLFRVRFRALSPPVLSFLFSRIRPPMTSLLHMNVVETWFVAVWGLCWCNFVLFWFGLVWPGFCLPISQLVS